MQNNDIIAPNLNKGSFMKFFILMIMAVSFVFASVDINNASVKELTTLKGVGAKKAQSIIEYRKLHCFKKVDEIVKVKGFGNKFLQNNKKKLTVGKCKK